MIPLLIAELHGTVAAADVERWRRDLEAQVAAVPDGGGFKLLVDLTGYEPVDLDAHKAMRTIVPELLARHGMRPAVVDLFAEASDPEVTTVRGVRCVKFANVHHDAAKMADYERRIGREDQRFFSSRKEAERWLS